MRPLPLRIAENEAAYQADGTKWQIEFPITGTFGVQNDSKDAKNGLE